MSKGFTIIGTLAALTILVIAAGCLNQKPTQPNPGELGGMCGGIAGIECEKGFVCQFEDTNPDAAGLCVKVEEQREPTNFAECVQAGYPVMESYPRQCRIPDGKVFVEETGNNGQPGAKEGAFCGGIAGFPCAEGLDCQLDGNYPDAGGTCVKAEVRPPILAREGERCGGFDSRACNAGLICDWTDGPPGSSDMGSGNCVRIAETGPPLPPQEGNGCILMYNQKTDQMGCFGCGKTVCVDPSPDWMTYRTPGEAGLRYSCYIDEEGACALAQ